MSYSFNIERDEDGLRLTPASGLSNIPVGAIFKISGHQVSDGELGTQWVTLALDERKPDGISVNASRMIDRRVVIGADPGQTTP